LRLGARGLAALPAGGDTVALYLADCAAAGLKASSIGRALTAIVQAHLGASHASPRSAAVKAVLQGIRRRHGAAPAQKAPLSLEELRRILEPLGDRPIEVRDRALLLVGFAGASRRSEVVGLDWEHLTDDREGLRVRLVRSKTDQEGQGRVVGIPFGGRPGTCPVRALRAPGLAGAGARRRAWGGVRGAHQGRPEHRQAALGLRRGADRETTGRGCGPGRRAPGWALASGGARDDCRAGRQG
jgi:integrase